MADRTLVFAQNGRHSLRGLTQVNPAEFLAWQDEYDDLTYVCDLAAYLDGATISSVTRTPSGVTISNTSNTTTRVTQRLKGFGHADFRLSLSSGDTEEFRIVIRERASTTSSQAAEVPTEMPQAYTSTSDPTINDDSTDGHVPGANWINTASLNQFTCVSNAVGAAIWRHHQRIWQGTTSQITGTTAETAFVAIEIPAGAMGANGRLDIHHGWENSNSANTKTRRIRFGSANNLSGTRLTEIGPTTNLAHFNKHVLANITASSQATTVGDITATGTYGGFAATFVTASVDTTLASYLVFSGQLANAGDTMVLKHYIVTLTRPDIGPI